MNIFCDVTHFATEVILILSQVDFLKRGGGHSALTSV